MGQEIATDRSDDFDEVRFKDNLRQESKILKGWFDRGLFSDAADPRCGLEVEAWLIDPDHGPATCAIEFLKRLGSACLVPELARFNFEINTSPRALRGAFLTDWRDEFAGLWSQCRAGGSALGVTPLLIGILPTVDGAVLTSDFMYPLKRYRALNDQLFRLRQGEPMHVVIAGRDELALEHHDVMLEAACTSIQIHLELNQHHAKRVFNASLIASAPAMAMSGNSPFFWGHDLWEETRIPLFEQSISVRSFKDAKGQRIGRVTFGTGYVRHSLLELFLENLNAFPVLLPIVQDGPPERLGHVRLQNGTIWRWNRPIVDFNADGTPHLRLEHRVMPAGPTLEDMVANIAFSTGLATYYANMDHPPEEQLPFESARQSFYEAARLGLKAEIDWLGGRFVARDLLLDRLIGEAAAGLERLQIDPPAISHYLNGIIGERVRTGRTGAWWQRAFVARYGRDFRALTRVYLENQISEAPVHRWLA